MSEPTGDNPATNGRKLPPMPRWLIYVVILSVVASWVPLALIARSRAQRSPKGRVHLFLDMDIQPNYRAQDTHPLFADGRAMRPPAPGTVARGRLRADDHYWRGYETDENLNPLQATGPDGEPTLSYYPTLPERLELDRALLERGRQRYEIYCSICHGHAGDGRGMVQRRVDELSAATAMGAAGPPAVEGWAPVRNLHEPRIRQYPVGRIFDVISRGFNTMSGYASQVPVEDRWAIAVYVKALQLSQNFPADELPQDLRDELESEPTE